MSQPQVFNNVTYSIPVQGDLRWGPALTRYLVALGTYSISPAGGLYPLTADLNFGTNFGVVAKYFSSESNGLASAGQLRMATNDLIGWRNVGGTADLYLTVNASNQLTFNGSILNTLTLPVSVTNGGTGVSALTTYAVLLGGTTTTGPVQDAGVGSSGQVLTSQGPGVKPIWSAAGTGSGTVNTGTANQLAYYASSTNAVSGLTAITASRTLVSDTNGLPVASAVTATTLAFLDVTSSVQTQINTKAPTASPTFTGAVTVPGLTSTGQIVFSPTTTGIKGTTTNDNAAASNVGELLTASTLRSSATAISSNSPLTIATLSLTAGDWDVFYAYGLKAGGATAYTTIVGAVSTTTNAIPPGDTQCVQDTAGQISLSYQVPVTPGSGNDIDFTGPTTRVSIGTTTSYFLVVNAIFTISTSTVYGSIKARRVR